MASSALQSRSFDAFAPPASPVRATIPTERKLISGPGGNVPVPSDAAEQIMVFESNDTRFAVVIEAASERSSAVRTVLARLRRDDPDFDVRQVASEQFLSLRPGRNDEFQDTAKARRLVAERLRHARIHDASDIHISPKEDRAELKYRIHGELIKIDTWSIAESKRFIQTAWGMSDVNSRAREYVEGVSKSAGLLHRLREFGLSDCFNGIRLNTNSLYYGGGATMRLQHAEPITAYRLSDIPWMTEQKPVLDYLLRIKYGGIFTCANLNHGKSKLQARMLTYINGISPSLKISTVEQPVEFVLPFADSWSVTSNGNNERADDYTSALRHVLRSDANVFMAQEMRDAETADLVIQLVYAGKTFSSIHATNPFGAVDKMKNWSVNESDLCNSHYVTGLIGVALVQRTCPGCRRTMREAIDRGIVSEAEAHRIARDFSSTTRELFQRRGAEAPDFELMRFRDPAGCETCRVNALAPRGIAGRVQLAQVVKTDRRVLELAIREGSDVAAVYAHKTLGAPRIWEHALTQVAQGNICPITIQGDSGLGPLAAALAE